MASIIIWLMLILLIEINRLELFETAFNLPIFEEPEVFINLHLNPLEFLRNRDSRAAC